MRGDETIRDVVHSLADAEDYVRRVLGNMAAYKKKVPHPVVKIGSTGAGKYPHYRLEPRPTEGTGFDAFAGDFGNFIAHMRAYHGRSHEPMEWSALQIQGDHWSSSAMDFAEVQDLLGQLRSSKRR